MCRENKHHCKHHCKHHMNQNIISLIGIVTQADSQLNTDLSNASQFNVAAVQADIAALAVALNNLNIALSQPVPPVTPPANVAAAFTGPVTSFSTALLNDFAAASFNSAVTESDVSALITALQALQTALANPSTP